jgi:Xaa-Pro dipeptidase
MSKLQHVQNYLDSNKLGLAIFSDPISIYYLTGYLSDPHERHMLLFVMPDHESLLFLPGLDVERAVATVDFPVAGYMDSENPWQIIK